MPGKVVTGSGLPSSLNSGTMDTKWHPIEPLDESVAENLRGDLAALRALQRSWQDFAFSLDEADRNTLRRRTLRKHAIETGIIERLYDIDWGVTETLVAEGLTREAIARGGGELSPGVLPMLQAQMEGLEMVTEYVRSEFPLTTSFIKQLHALITRTQTTYEATDALGRPLQAKLQHGSFKTLPNNVIRPDGSLMEFAPPEQLAGEMENLVKWFNGMHDVNPVVSAAWLHHRFVQIHPFQDGNGRVARALTLLSLGRLKYPPIVVSRNNRDTYILALEQGNGGNLTPLCHLFIKLAMRSIRRELGEPIPGPLPQTYREVSRAIASSLEQREHQKAEQRERAAQLLAEQLHGRIKDWLEKAGDDIEEDFQERGREVRVWRDDATPDDDAPPSTYRQPKSKWWRYQIIKTAKQADHYADLSPGTWWAMLRVTVNGLQMQFLTSIHHVGRRRTGVMAITSFGDIRSRQEKQAAYEDTFVETSSDAFTFTYDEEVEDRAGELYDWLDQSLTVSLRELMLHTLGG